MNMFIEFIPLSLAYNFACTPKCTQFRFDLCISDMHTLHLETIMYMSSVYMRALNKRFDVINPAYTCMFARVFVRFTFPFMLTLM